MTISANNLKVSSVYAFTTEVPTFYPSQHIQTVHSFTEQGFQAIKDSLFCIHVCINNILKSQYLRYSIWHIILCKGFLPAQSRVAKGTLFRLSEFLLLELSQSQCMIFVHVSLNHNSNVGVQCWIKSRITQVLCNTHSGIQFSKSIWCWQLIFRVLWMFELLLSVTSCSFVINAPNIASLSLRHKRIFQFLSHVLQSVLVREQLPPSHLSCSISYACTCTML